MDSFVLDFHSKIFFGLGSEEQIGTVLRQAGLHRILIHYDAIAEQLGLLEKIRGLLMEQDLYTAMLGGVRANPSLSLVRQGIQRCLAEKIDCVVAIGGGSVMDSAKAIVIGAGNPEIDIWDCYEGRIPAPVKALKLAVVPTTAATGSETNASSVLSNDETQGKRSLFCDASRSSFAFMDPGLLYTLPKFQRSCTVADIYVHSHERYCAHHGENMITDTCSEGNMRVLLDQGRRFVEQADDYQAASEVMFAGTHAYLTCGLGGPFDWGTHNLAHEISGHFHDRTHAATITAMWGSWASYVCQYNVPRFAQYARRVFDIQVADDAQAALRGIEETVTFFRDLGMPTTVREMMGRQFTTAEIEAMAESCTYFGRRPTIGKLKELDRQDIVRIYTMANEL